MLSLLEVEELKASVMMLAERMIDYMEVSITNHEHYTKLRSRTLRLANDLCRKIDRMSVNGLTKKNGNGKGE